MRKDEIKLNIFGIRNIQKEGNDSGMQEELLQFKKDCLNISGQVLPVLECMLNAKDDKQDSVLGDNLKLIQEYASFLPSLPMAFRYDDLYDSARATKVYCDELFKIDREVEIDEVYALVKEMAYITEQVYIRNDSAPKYEKKDIRIIEFLTEAGVDKGFMPQRMLIPSYAPVLNRWINSEANSITCDIYLDTEQTYDFMVIDYEEELLEIEGLEKSLADDGVCILFVPKHENELLENEVNKFENHTGLFANRIDDDLYILTKANEEYFDIVARIKAKREAYVHKKPLVSVLMPAYNHEKFVEKTIESVLNQTYDNIEFLAADDFSKDNTPNILKKYEDKFAFLYFSDVNRGAQTGILLDNAKGKYIAIISSDDYWECDKIEKQVIYLETHPNCAACFTGVNCVGENDEKYNVDLFTKENKTKEKWFERFFRYGNCLCHPSILMEKERYYSLVKTPSTMCRQIPDFWKWIMLVQEQDIHVIEKELINFRWHETGNNENTSSRTMINQVRHINEEAYIWYHEIKNMDNEFFLRTFYYDLVNKSASTDVEVMCEKYLLLAKSDKAHQRLAAYFLLFDDVEVYYHLEKYYGLKRADIHKLTGSIGIIGYNE